MKWLPVSIVAILAALVCAGQNMADLESPAVNRVAARLSCPCGCKTNMACRMEPYPCRICKDHKVKILDMQARGMSDEAILGTFAREEGQDIIAVPPGVFGSLASYAALFIGLFMVIVVIRKYRRKQPAVAGPVADENLARYNEQIEKHLSGLE